MATSVFIVFRKLILVFSVFFLVLVASLTCNSCLRDSTTPKTYATIKSTKKIGLKLPPETTLSSITKIQFSRINNEIIVSYYDAPYKKLYINSLVSGKLIKTIKVNAENYNSHESSLYFYNYDSIFLLDYINCTLYLIDQNGNFKRNWALRNKRLIKKENESGNVYIPFPSDGFNSNGFYFYNKAVYIASSGNESVDYSQNCRDVYKVDLKSNQVSLVFQKPAIYYSGYWGMNLLHNFQILKCPNSNKFILSYGADSMIYCTNFDNQPEAFVVKSDFLMDLKPLNSKRPTQALRNPEVEEYDYISGFYFTILFDEKTQSFYRFVNCPVTKDYYNNYLQSGVFKPEISVIKTDDQFNKIAERVLPNKSRCPIYVFDDYFYFIDSESYRNNSDSIYFESVKYEI